MPRFLLMVLALVTAASVGWSQGLQNPGFEEVADGRPVGWELGGGARLIVDPTIAHAGDCCVMGRFDDGIAQRIAIEGGSAYRITGWIRRVHPEGMEVPKIKVYFLDAAGNRVSVEATEFQEVTGEWSQWETVMQAPAGATTMNLTLRGFFGGSEWFYWDDLAMEKVEAPDWPAWEDTPNLDGMTVVVPDIADVWTDALLRWPSQALIPIDGRLDTSALLEGEDVRVELTRPVRTSWALIHSMRPGMNLGRFELRALSPTTRLLAESRPSTELVKSLQFDPYEVGEVLLDVPEQGRAYVNEIQLLGLSEGGTLPGDRVASALTVGAPETMADDLAAAWAAESQRASLTATDAPAGGEVTLAAGRYVNVFVMPREDEYGVSGVSLDLALRGTGDGNMLEVTLKRPAELDVNLGYVTRMDRGIDAGGTSPRDYATVFRVVSRVEDGRLRASFDVPDLLFAAGEPVWLTLRARRDMTLDLARSQVAVHVVTPQTALAEYVPQLERLMRHIYSEASEAHAYDGRDWSKMILGRYVRRVLELDPDNQPATYIYRRIAHVREEIKLQRPGPEDAPDWAVWAREALRRRHEIIMWWLDHRQYRNGELGGHINDDGEFSCNWPSHYLMVQDERIADALRKLADVAWEMSAGTGYTVGSRDVEHAAEDQSCTQPQVLLVDYGSPKAVERFMVMSSYFDLWTHINEAGRRQFRSYMFNTKQVWDDPPFDVDHPYCPLAMVGTGHLIWYADSPQVAEVFLQEAESWALGCLSTDGGKPEGKIPFEIHANTSQINPYAPYPTNPILRQRSPLYRGGAGAYIVRYFLRGAYALTGDKLFERVITLWEPSDEEKLERARQTLARFTGSEERWRPTEPETTLYDAWKVTGDRTWLVEELKEVVRQQIRNRWLLTEAEPYTDRIPVPGRELLSRLFLGDWTSGKSHVPGHWVSWEGGGLDYAAAVLDARPDHLKAIVYSFHEQPTPMTMRVWRLPHGRYQVIVGIDRDGDDEPDEEVMRDQRELWRYDGALSFTAQPGKTLVIELTLLEKLEDIRTRPDLAIGPDDVTREGNTLSVTVHNIGGSAAPASVVQVLDGEEHELVTAPVPALDPPHDLQPKIATVRIDLPGGAEPTMVLLDPEDAITEITEANNAVTIGD